MITFVLILITVGISIQAFYQAGVMDKLILNPYSIKHQNEWWRMLSSGFLHADWSHLLMNMFVLFAFGSEVEAYYNLFFGPSGKVLFPLLYVSSIIAANASSYYKNQNNTYYNSLGASGATSAIVFASILFNPMQKFYFGIPGILMGIIYLVYSNYAAKQNADRINHEAHFYGAVYGVLFTLVLKPQIGLYFIDQIIRRFV
ncbi:MAG: rhomboid family intramembrane serine protease [Bacteroidia bacterium]